MNKHHQIKALLYRSLEEELPEKDKNQLQTGLETFPDLAEEKRRLEALRMLLGNSQPDPSPEFVAKVMRELPRENSREIPMYLLLARTLPRIAAALILALAIALAAIYYLEGNLTPDALVGAPRLTPEEALTILNP